jgi:hypothetical protein
MLFAGQRFAGGSQQRPSLLAESTGAARARRLPSDLSSESELDALGEAGRGYC